MAAKYIERRIVKAGLDLCERQLQSEGAAITADSIRSLKVNTLSPVIQGIYVAIGAALIAFALWVHFETRNMALSIVVLFLGVGHFILAGVGRPRLVGELEGQVNLMELTNQVVKEFVRSKDAELEGRKGGR